jgi:hypothetical protein
VFPVGQLYCLPLALLKFEVPTTEGFDLACNKFRVSGGTGLPRWKLIKVFDINTEYMPHVNYGQFRSTVYLFQSVLTRQTWRVVTKSHLYVITSGLDKYFFFAMAYHALAHTLTYT